MPNTFLQRFLSRQSSTAAKAGQDAPGRAEGDKTGSATYAVPPAARQIRAPVLAVVVDRAPFTVRWLRSQLAGGGPQPVSEILAAGRAARISERQIFRAANALQVRRVGKARDGKTWEL